MDTATSEAPLTMVAAVGCRDEATLEILLLNHQLPLSDVLCVKPFLHIWGLPISVTVNGEDNVFPSKTEKLNLDKLCDLPKVTQWVAKQVFPWVMQS
jgi:hypothetical protein